MKKLFATLAIAMLSASLCFAQLQLATLNHNDSISVFYGSRAFQQAHAAAASGDIITLSPGVFNSVNITKAISVRGAGMYPDSIAETEPTSILGSFTINITDSVNRLYVEGIYFAGENVNFYLLSNPQFIKCRFRTFHYTATNSCDMINACFVNCIMDKFDGYSYAHNTQFVNSVILDLDGTGNHHLVNSIANMNPGLIVSQAAYIQNSIVYYSYNNPPSANAYSAFNSIGINTYNTSYVFFKQISNHNLYNYKSFASVFKKFRGSECDNYQLLDTIAENILGSDGTQIGIYGGYMPFDPSVRNPLVKKVNVASRSNNEGKLPVDIEIVSE